MKKQTLINVFLLVIALASLIISICLYTTRPKIIFVNNNTVFEKYLGVKEGQHILNKDMEKMQANLDTLEKEINIDLKHYQDNYNNLSVEEKKNIKDMINKKKKQFYRYKKALEEKTNEKDHEISAGILNQINTYMTEYGKEKEYDAIIGVTDMGNVLFARDKFDKTEEVIEGLNKKYSGE